MEMEMDMSVRGKRMGGEGDMSASRVRLYSVVRGTRASYTRASCIAVMRGNSRCANERDNLFVAILSISVHAISFALAYPEGLLSGALLAAQARLP